VLAFQNRLDDCNADQHIIGDSDHSISDRNSASFRAATPEFTRFNCCTADVDQHTRLSLTAFGEGC